MAKLLLPLVAALLLLASARAATFVVQAGATSTDGNWILRGYFPIDGLADFSIETGDSLTFVVGGFPKTIVITDRPFIPIVDDQGDFDPALNTASGASPLTVTFASNETYSSGLLAVGANFTFTFISAGTYELFEIMEGVVVASVIVNPAGTPGPYTPAQAARYTQDLISRDEVTGFEQIGAATDASAAGKGTIALGFTSGEISYTGFIGGNPIEVVIGSAIKFTNRDARALNVFINASNEFNVPALPFGGPSFLAAAGDTIDTGLSASSGLIYPGQSYSITFLRLGTYAWHSTIGGMSGNVTCVKPPPKQGPLSGGRAFAAFVVVIAILLLIFVIGCIIMIACKYACIEGKKLEARAEASMHNLTDGL